jgi:hypothetical protein
LFCFHFSSPFWCFAVDFKKQQKAKGINIIGDTQLKEMAGHHWNKMSEAEKSKYKDVAKNSPSIPNTTRVTYNALGQSISEVDAMKQKALDEESVMKDDIQMMLGEANNKGGKFIEKMVTLIILIISANFVFRT